MKYKAITYLVFWVCAFTLNAQVEYPSATENDLFWQPTEQISFSHFQEVSDTACLKYFEKYGFQMSSNIELRGVVDIPKAHLSEKIKKRIGFDKLYLVPVFCKNCSCILSQDSVELKVHQLLFDVAEMCARGVRKDLSEMQSAMNINNVNTMYYITVKNTWEDRMRGMMGSILQEALILKKDTAYTEYRQLVDELLEENKRFETKPEDIHRYIIGKPIEKDYLQAEQIIGDLQNKEEK